MGEMCEHTSGMQARILSSCNTDKKILCFWFLPTAVSGIDSATFALFNFKYAPADVTNWRTVFDLGKFLCDIGSVGGSVATS